MNLKLRPPEVTFQFGGFWLLGDGPIVAAAEDHSSDTLRLEVQLEGALLYREAARVQVGATVPLKNFRGRRSKI